MVGVVLYFFFVCGQWLGCFYNKLPSQRGLGVYQPWNCWICWNLLRISKTLSNNCRGRSVTGPANFSNVHHIFRFRSDKFQECLVHSAISFHQYHVDQHAHGHPSGSGMNLFFTYNSWVKIWLLDGKCQGWDPSKYPYLIVSNLPSSLHLQKGIDSSIAISKGVGRWVCFCDGLLGRWDVSFREYAPWIRIFCWDWLYWRAALAYQGMA